LRTRDVLEGRIGYQLKRAEHALRVEMDGVLRGLGLTTPQYAVLSVLDDEPGLSGAALARRCFVTPQTMNQIVAKLEKEALISRRDHPEHGRIRQAYLTERGEELVSRAHRDVEDVEERMLAGFDADERLDLLRTLSGLVDGLRSGEKP
jgi:DNA-binding MarR family transcriptional regulator